MYHVVDYRKTFFFSLRLEQLLQHKHIATEVNIGQTNSTRKSSAWKQQFCCIGLSNPASSEAILLI